MSDHELYKFAVTLAGIVNRSKGGSCGDSTEEQYTVTAIREQFHPLTLAAAKEAATGVNK